jgi:hypothetical protein
MALVNPNIAMSFRQPEFTPRNALAEYAQIQQIQGGQRQAEIADMQLAQMRQKEKAIGQIQARAAQGGGPTDRRAIAKAYLESGDPEFMQFGLKMETTLDELDAFNRIMGGGTAPTPAPNAMAASDMPSSAPGAMAAPAAPEDRLGDFISQIEAKRNAPIPMPAVTGGGGMGAEMPLAPAPVTPSANALAPTPTPSTNALMPKGVAPADPVAALRTKRDQLIAVGTPRALQAARSIDSDIALMSKTIAAPSEIKKLEDEIATLIQNGAKPDDPSIVARRGKISQLSGVGAPTEISRAINERDRLIASGRSQTDPDVAALNAYIRKQTTHAPSAQQTVNAYTPASVEAQKQFVQAATDERKMLRTAPDTLKNIDAAIKLIPTASTFMGKGGEPLLAAASFLNNRLGFGISTQGVTDATVLRTRLFEGILDNLKKLDSQPSQEQQRVLSEALGNLGTDPAALEKILNRIGETVRDRVGRFNEDVSQAEARGVMFPFKPQISLPPPKATPDQIPGAPTRAPAPAARTVARTGTLNGRRVIQYSDGSIEYGN